MEQCITHLLGILCGAYFNQAVFHVTRTQRQPIVNFNVLGLRLNPPPLANDLAEFGDSSHFRHVSSHFGYYENNAGTSKHGHALAAT